jgi:hypothetical protein
MTDSRTTLPGEIEGFLSGCPFCTSYRIGILEIGSRFRIISAFKTGTIGTVVEWPKNVPKIPDEFMAHLDHDPPEWQIRISIKQEMIQVFPFPPTPEWAPPLSMRDASELDKTIICFCAKSFQNGKWKIDWNSFNGVIRMTWYNRLPLEPDELWLVLKAHGVPEKSKRNLVGFYERGRNLLVYSGGRKPIKKKKVEPLTI